MLGNKK